MVPMRAVGGALLAVLSIFVFDVRKEYTKGINLLWTIL